MTRIQLIRKLNKQARVVRSYQRTYEKCRESGDTNKERLLNKADDLLDALRAFGVLMKKFASSLENKGEFLRLCCEWDALEALAYQYDDDKRQRYTPPVQYFCSTAEELITRFSELTVEMVNEFEKCIGGGAE